MLYKHLTTVCTYSQQGYVFGHVSLCICGQKLFLAITLKITGCLGSFCLKISCNVSDGRLRILENCTTVSHACLVETQLCHAYECGMPTCNCSAHLQYRYRYSLYLVCTKHVFYGTPVLHGIDQFT